MSAKIYFYKELTPAEVGNTKTHEIYIRLPNDFDYIEFFHNSASDAGSVIEVNFSASINGDTSNVAQLRFVFFASSNREKRIPSLGPLFKENDVEEGDVVCLESELINGVPSYNLRFFKKGTINVKPATVYLKCPDMRDTTYAKLVEVSSSSEYLPYITAIRTKPFVLLAGISGTGKSRIVRELARACWPTDDERRKAQKPENYEIVQVKPNWHDSSELIGYVSRITGKPQYVPGKFIESVAKAWANPEIPYFLCLDEMNLAPVEQYFAEYLSVIETRKKTDAGIVTDPLLSKSEDEWYGDLVRSISPTEEVQRRFLTEGITIPQNLIVMGTVNMDETTFTFSRKVLDRAMTIEMNEVNLNGGLDRSKEEQLLLEPNQLIGDAAEGYDVYPNNKEVCDKVIAYLEEINGVLENTPFKIAYRARNEFLMYAVNRLLLSGSDDSDAVLASAMDEMTSMKILSRIEGDEQKIHPSLFANLREVVKAHIKIEEGSEKDSPSLSKINEMEKKLRDTGFTSFWS